VLSDKKVCHKINFMLIFQRNINYFFNNIPNKLYFSFSRYTNTTLFHLFNKINFIKLLFFHLFIKFFNLYKII